MNAPFTQTYRRSKLTTALGGDVLVLLALNGTERLSGDFEWRVEALSANRALDLNALLGTHATVSVETTTGERHFDGIVTEAQRLGANENDHRYSMVLRPWFHVAGLRRNQRIFHNQTVSEILGELFQDYAGLGSPHYLMQLGDDYPVLEYTVQYGETDAAFAARMMERFGITWHWRHSAGNHILVLTDDAANHKDVPEAERPYYGTERTHLEVEEHFHEWHSGAQMTTGAVRLTDYNFKTPTAVQEVTQQASGGYQHGTIESFDYPGDYLDRGTGKSVVSRRTGAEEAQGLRVTAHGNVASLGAGGCVTLTGDELPDATGLRFLCLRAEHVVRTQSYSSTEDLMDERDYDGAYILVPDSAPMRPERRTTRPVIHGPQTAMVVGDGEIDCDEYGRILVRFHWDLHNRYSMRCRVSQNWAAKGWGGVVIPRIGMEVIVEYLEGDPDKPIVTGCVYNGTNQPPYPLPQHKTKSVLRSDTHQGDGFNEISLEDRNGDEQIYIHAEMDQDIEIKNELREWVGVDLHQRVDNDRVTEAKNDASDTVGRNRIDSTGATHAATVGKDSSLSVGSKFSVTAGDSTFLKGGKVAVFESGGDLVIKAPGGFIRIGSDGITIRGNKVNINSGGSPFDGTLGESLTPRSPDRAKVKT